MRLLFCIADASTTEEPGAEKLHAGSVRGAPGNRLPTVEADVSGHGTR